MAKYGFPKIVLALILFCGFLQAQQFSPVPTLSFVKHFGGIDPLPQTVTIKSTGTNFDFNNTPVTDSGGNWLSVTVTGFNCCATPRAITVLIKTTPSMAAGAYTGHISLVSFPSGAITMSIPVVLTVEPAGGTFFDNLPGQLSFSVKTGGSAAASQQIQIRNGGSGTLNWHLATSTADAGNWLTTSTSTGTAPSIVTIGVSVTNLPGGGLVAGTFVGQLVFSQASGGSVTVPISVVVGVNNTFSQVNGINFTKVFGGADPLPQTLTIPSIGANFDFDTDTYTATGGSWLSVAAVGFNCCATPRAVTATVTTTPAMAVGTYTGQIVFTVEGNGAMAITVPVTLTVEPATGTFFDNMTGQLSFSLVTNGTAITSQQLQVRNGGAGSLNWSLAATTSDTGQWLTVSSSNGTAPSVVTVGISVANLPGGGLIAGNFIGELVFSQPSGGTVTVPVSVVVGANVFNQVNGINFTKVYGGADPLPQTLTIPSTGTNFDFDTNSYTATGGNWLSVTADGFNCCATPREVTATVTTSSTLAVGAYTGEIVFTSQIAGAMAITIPVTLTVESPTGTFFDNMPGQISFAMKTGGSAITAQPIQVRNGGQGVLAWTAAASTSDGGNWLTISAASGTAPSVLTVGVTVAKLPGAGLIAGHFIGEVVFSQPLGGSVTVPVSVTVGANIFNQVNPINFTKVYGGAEPLPQTLTISSAGTNFNFDTNSFTATGGAWFSTEAIGTNCCATPRPITVTVATSSTLAPGTYTGQIVFTEPNDGSLAITVPVTLTVVPATATFFDDLPGQMSFSFTPTTSNPPMQDVQVRQRGSGTFNWTLAASTDDSGNWLTTSVTGGAGAGTVHVGVNAAALPGGGLIAGTFVGNLLFNSASSTVTIPVLVTIGANVFVQLPAISFTKQVGSANPTSQDLAIASTGTNFDFEPDSYTATGGNWLSFTVAGFNCCATPRTITANIIAGPTLAVGSYTGQIVISGASNQVMAMTIPVILTVTPGPTVASVTPNTGQAGQTLASVAIVGQNSNFVQGTTVANFGAAITVNTLTVNSPTSATARITIQPTALLGARNVTLTTGPEVATLTGGFTVAASACDVNQSGTINVADVQLIINQALGVASSTNDINHDGTVNVADVQIVINGALGLGCPY